MNKSEILYGVENAVGRGVYFMSNVKQSMDIFFDYRAPSIVTDIAEYRDGYNDIRKRGGKIRCFTEITRDNLRYCKELMKLVDELRHLDGVRGGMAVSESEYMATTVLQETKPLTQVIYSSVKEVVEQGQYIFDTLWNASIPAQKKIREIEEGTVPHYTKVVNVPDDIIKEIIRLNEVSNELSICATAGGMQFTYNYLFGITNKLLDRAKKGQHKGIRYISNIDRDNVEIAKILLDTGIQLVHIKSLPPLSFGVSDKEIGATIEKMEQGNTVQNLLISNEPVYVDHFKFIFEELWRNGMDASDRIRNIEEGVDLAEVEVIENPKESINRAIKISTSSREELSVLFSTPNSFHRQVQAGLDGRLREYVRRKIRVRLLIPFHTEIANTIEQLKRTYPQVYFKSIDASIQTKMSIVLADRKECLLVETRDDTKDNHEQAAGISIYSNSKSIVLSYVYIFDSLWRQSELYEQVKLHDKIQKEFIDIAAHELRTPIQPILGLSEILKSKITNKNECELIDAIARNAKRLHRLTEDILDVTKIESQSLQLHKEKFNLNDVITSVLADYEGVISRTKDVKVSVISNGDIPIEADKGRLNQVISNLLNNAFKFTQKGSIVISSQIKDNDNNVIVFVKDTGVGIDQGIMSRLFSKFASKSFTGTGIGLFISKSIIESHGGRIWAENNPDGKGATFSFALPLSH
jgi:nitrogen-specific signal transduction histidine kinase